MHSVAALFGNLRKYEGKIALREVIDKKKKGIALLTEAVDYEEDEEDDEDINDDELVMLVKKFRKFFRKKKNFKKPFRHDGNLSKRENKEPPTCFKCKKVEHIKWDCPQ